VITLETCQALDEQDALRPLRHQFALPAGVIYLDGNSLGALPKTTAARIEKTVSQEWGEGLIRSWNDAGWVDQPQRLGNKIARLTGAGPGEVVVADSTSVNLYKVLSAALSLAAHDAPSRKIILSERSNFPTDLYMAEGLCKTRGFTLKMVEVNEIEAALTADVALLLLTHINYRTGAMFDMAGITRAAHKAGVLTVWDLAHSAGAVPVDLTGSQADFAVGCGYKFLNGGPGAPAFVWVNPKHLERKDVESQQPLTGWFGHASPFAFTPHYTPAQGIQQYLCGTPSVLGLAALECGIDTLLSAEPLGGMAALYAKSLALTDLFMALVEARCAGHGLTVVTPLAHSERGSQVSLACASIASAVSVSSDANSAVNSPAYAIMRALISRGVIGDFRAGSTSTDSGSAVNPDILRFGFTPLYIGFADVWQAVEHLKQVLESGEWQRPEFNQRQAVT
jgi:kynureninase